MEGRRRSRALFAHSRLHRTEFPRPWKERTKEAAFMPNHSKRTRAFRDASTHPLQPQRGWRLVGRTDAPSAPGHQHSAPSSSLRTSECTQMESSSPGPAHFFSRPCPLLPDFPPPSKETTQEAGSHVQTRSAKTPAFYRHPLSPNGPFASPLEGEVHGKRPLEPQALSLPENDWTRNGGLRSKHMLTPTTSPEGTNSY